MKNIVIIQEFGARLSHAKEITILREQDFVSTLDQFKMKNFKSFKSFEDYLEKNSICILSNERIYKKLIESLSE